MWFWNACVIHQRKIPCLNLRLRSNNFHRWLPLLSASFSFPQYILYIAVNCTIFFSLHSLQIHAPRNICSSHGQNLWFFQAEKYAHAGQRMFPRHPAHFHSKVRVAAALLEGSSSRRGGITTGSEAANFPKLKLNHTAEKMITSPAGGFPLHCMQKRAKSSHGTLGLGGAWARWVWNAFFLKINGFRIQRCSVSTYIRLINKMF